MTPDFTGATRGRPSPETNPDRPLFDRLTNFATGPEKAPSRMARLRRAPLVHPPHQEADDRGAEAVDHDCDCGAEQNGSGNPEARGSCKRGASVSLSMRAEDEQMGGWTGVLRAVC